MSNIPRSIVFLSEHHSDEFEIIDVRLMKCHALGYTFLSKDQFAVFLDVHPKVLIFEYDKIYYTKRLPQKQIDKLSQNEQVLLSDYDDITFVHPIKEYRLVIFNFIKSVSGKKIECADKWLLSSIDVTSPKYLSSIKEILSKEATLLSTNHFQERNSLGQPVELNYRDNTIDLKSNTQDIIEQYPISEESKILVKDPRTESYVQVLAFYYPDRLTECDKLCDCEFLSNFYPCKVKMSKKRSSETYTFLNAESAFQALKDWNNVEEYTNLTGTQSYVRKRSLLRPDFNYAGYGNNWDAMMNILVSKYDTGTEMRSLLLSTGDAFLLEHNEKVNRDTYWSNNNNGEGKNCLGVMLMIIRDYIRKGSSWTDFFSEYGLKSKEYKNLVLQSTTKLKEKLTDIHGKMTFNIKYSTPKKFHSMGSRTKVLIKEKPYFSITERGKSGWYIRDVVNNNKKSLYLFGENCLHKNTNKIPSKTQAVIRGLSNSVGIRTCYKPGSGFRDNTYDKNIKMIREDFEEIISKTKKYTYINIVAPGDGIGTGVANLDLAPKTKAFLDEQMRKLIKWANKSKN